jgi:hypothetical protein
VLSFESFRNAGVHFILQHPTILELIILLMRKRNTQPTPCTTATPQLVRGVPKHLFKQLLTDIEASGGLSEGFLLKRICDQNPLSYGSPNSKRRKQIQNRTDRLKKLSATDYQEYLNFFGVHSSRQTHFLIQPENAAVPELPPSPSIMTTPRRTRMSNSGTPPDSPPLFRSPSLLSSAYRGRALDMNGLVNRDLPPPPLCS